MCFSILRTVIYSLGLALLLGCVTEQSYVDSNQQVRSLSFDKKDAAKSRLLLGLGYLHNKNYPQAKFNLNKALEYAPKRADVHYSLAYYYQAVGESTLAEQAYQKSLDIEPNNPDTLNNYGVFLCDLGNYEKALIQFKLAITTPTYTQVAQSYENMALCTLKSNDFANAINYLNTSYQHNPNRPETLLNLISLHYAKGDIPLAFELYKRYLFNFEETPSILLVGFLLETSSGRHGVAKQYLMRLSSMFPLSRENLLLNANLLHESIFEQRKQQYLNNQVSDIQSVNQKRYEKFKLIESTKKNVVNPVVFGGINVTEKIPTLVIDPHSVHSVVGIGKNLSLPEEIIISERSDNSDLEIIERVPLLDINVDNVEIPRYTVQYGENLYRVSIKFNIQISTLMEWNNLKKQQINTGDQLYVQNPDVFYTVKKSNNLSAIADELNIPLNKLMQWNKVEQDGVVAAGTQILKVEVEPLK